MPKTVNPLARLRDEICDAWENWPDRENPKYWPTMNMHRFYMAMQRDYPDLAERMPPEHGDEIWQRLKYLLLHHEEFMGRN